MEKRLCRLCRRRGTAERRPPGDCNPLEDAVIKRCSLAQINLD